MHEQSAFDLADRRAAAASGMPATVVAPSGRKQTLAAGTSSIELGEAGFYETQRGSGLARLVAVNIETAESDLTSLDRDELDAALRPGGRAPEPGRTTTTLNAGARQFWWRAALISVALLMLLEAVLAAVPGQKAAS